ncbi:MAG: sigma 54-interacting transcriptional regulator [Fusobacterium gastrosuis]|uniref:sigma-54 interaction domain-containing protein n=1 Tax=Fusobacterium gastrosuis TaxID=1755100 RepID=UPI002A8862B0|nr:sigma 54-interacting transcriptional regulator [Fusobacterium gastrosuis]
MEITEELKNIFDSLYDGILIIDNKGIVKYINPSYTRITRLEEQDIINKKLLDVRKDSHLTEVMKTGKKKIGLYRTIADIKYLVNMVPIYKNNKIIGGISVVNDMQDIQKTLDSTLNTLNSLKEKVRILNKNKYSFDSIIAVDKRSIELKKYTQKIAKNDSNILITGETGTGKELFANAIHGYSKRKNAPFITLNCASLEKEMLERELFGFSENGKEEIGLFQLADGGTLYLEEVSELDYSLQNKLLKVLQNMTIRKIESLNEIPVNFRLICSTNRDLLMLVEKGQFRMDLYYRISVIPLKLLSLKNRRDDIPVLADKFLKDLSFKYRKDIYFSEEVVDILYNYDWPGNIRELKNIVEFLFNTVDDSVIVNENLPEYLNLNKKIENIKNLDKYIKEVEKKYIKKVLTNYEDNLEGKKKAANALNISLATLYNKLNS